MSQIGTIEVFGMASGRLVKSLQVYDFSAQETLMKFLQENHIPVASSCNGDGVCKKCLILIAENSLLSCQVQLIDLFRDNKLIRVNFSYL